jgi:hypothetical protein
MCFTLMYINQMSAPLLLIPGFLFPGWSERLPTAHFLVGWRDHRGGQRVCKNVL